MQFIKCKECDIIIEVKDLKEPFTPDILDRATEENTVHGDDLCHACTCRHEEERIAAEEAARQAQQAIQTEGNEDEGEQQ